MLSFYLTTLPVLEVISKDSSSGFIKKVDSRPGNIKMHTYVCHFDIFILIWEVVSFLPGSSVLSQTSFAGGNEGNWADVHDLEKIFDRRRRVHRQYLLLDPLLGSKYIVV